MVSSATNPWSAPTVHIVVDPRLTALGVFQKLFRRWNIPNGQNIIGARFWIDCQDIALETVTHGPAHRISAANIALRKIVSAQWDGIRANGKIHPTAFIKIRWKTVRFFCS